MKWTIILIVFAFISSCALQKSRRQHMQTSIEISSGSYENKTWSSDLEFKRYSWFKDANMSHDILITSFSNKSEFAPWMGSLKEDIKQCKDFYIVGLYADLSSQVRIPYLKSQLLGTLGRDFVISDFEQNLKAHPNYKDWNLFEYKFLGLCFKTAPKKEFFVKIPGFTSKTVRP